MPEDITSDSSPETHFVERDDDAEVLWEVEEIVGEKRGKYRVRWAGVDEFGQPWPLDWVPKEDCTDPLVLNWKRTKAEKRKLQQERKRGARTRRKFSSAHTSIISKDSGATSSTASRSTVVQSPRNKASGKKRKSDERVERDQKFSPTVSQDSEADIVISSRPKKKRRISLGSSRAALSEEDSDTLSNQPQNRGSKHHLSRSKKRISQKHQTKPVLVYYEIESGSDEQLPTGSLSISTDSLSRWVSPASKSNTRTNSKRYHEEEEEETSSTTKVPHHVQGGVSKKPKLVKSSITTTHPLPEKRPSSRSPIRSTSPSNSLSLRELVPSTDKPHKTAEILIDKALQNDDDVDSALEYADDLFEVRRPSSPPAPPSAQPLKPTIALFMPSPSSSPPTPSSSSFKVATPKGKGRILELEPETVPETEGEGSQNHKHDEPDVSRSPTTTMKNSMVSKMKPRTPGSKKNILDADFVAVPLPSANHHTRPASPPVRPRKALHPIPQISPSKFTNIPSSTIESVETTGSGNGKDGYGSTIEQFSSPDKSSLTRTRSENKGKQKETKPYSSSEGGSLPILPAATDVIKKGVAMADAVKRRKLNGKGVVRTGGVTQTHTRLPLSTLFEKKRERGKSRTSSAGIGDEDEDEVGNQDSPSTLEEFADLFLDYEGGMGDGGGGGGQKAVKATLDTNGSTLQDTNKDVEVLANEEKEYLRQEEEESTQDLMMELQQQREVPDVNEGWVNPPAPVEVVSVLAPGMVQAPVASQQESSDADMANVIDSLEVAPKSSGPISLEELGPVKPPEQSQDSVPQDSPSRHSVHSVDSSMVIPATLSPTGPEGRVMNVFPSQSSSGGTQQQLESAMTLLHQKSEEISRLENLFSTAQTTVQFLEVNHANHELAAISWRTEKAKLVEETELLRESLEKALERVTFSEKNAEVFRDQYLRASTFVADTRAQNKELKERAEVAEAQASSGLEGIKGMYEMRVKKLEEEAEYHKRVTKFLMEQGLRTQDEEVRRRAGEYPELERICGELKERIVGLEEMREGSGSVIDRLERLVTESDKENERLRREKMEGEERMREEVEGLKRELEETRKAMVEKEKVGEEIEVFRCLWRKNGTEDCDAMFLSQEGLSHHVEFGGHIG